MSCAALDGVLWQVLFVNRGPSVEEGGEEGEGETPPSAVCAQVRRAVWSDASQRLTSPRPLAWS